MKIKNIYKYNSIILNDISSFCAENNELSLMVSKAKLIAGIKFKGLVWESNFNKKKITNLHVRGVNDSKHKIKLLKFRLTLYDKSFNEFFSKTILKNTIIESGDTFEIEIEKLRDYYVGFRFQEDSFVYDINLISYKITEDFKIEKGFYCEKIEKLKQI